MMLYPSHLAHPVPSKYIPLAFSYLLSVSLPAHVGTPPQGMVIDSWYRSQVRDGLRRQANTKNHIVNQASGQVEHGSRHKTYMDPDYVQSFLCISTQNLCGT